MEKDLKKRYEILGHKVVPVKLPTTIRINTLRIKEKDLIERLSKAKITLKKIPYLQYAYTAKASFSLGAIPEYLLGYFYLQEAASQIPVEVLDPKPGETVLDCCAAPGGKTTQIAQLMKNQGLVVAFDNKSRRILSLNSNLERCGVINTAVFLRDITHASNDIGNIDKILVDAPCSGNYIVDPEWFEKKTLDDIKKNAYRQYNIMESVINTFSNKNTEIVYSTCSLEPEENEFIVEHALNNGMEIKETGFGNTGIRKFLGQNLDKRVQKTTRIWPFESSGFFLAKMVKK